jgi:hypothetical protein
MSQVTKNDMFVFLFFWEENKEEDGFILVTENIETNIKIYH